MTVATGSQAISVAVNPVTNKIYIANFGGNTVTVLDGVSNATGTVVVGSGPVSVGVNAVTNKVYVSNLSSNSVTVIDGVTNGTTTVAAGTNPGSAAVNPVTNKIYAINSGSNSVTVIDGATNATTAVALPAGAGPSSVAVNAATNQIYVANQTTGSSITGNVTVIDGATNSTRTLAVGALPNSVAINPVTNKIYVANFDGADVSVIDGSTNTTASATIGLKPSQVIVNPVSNKAYVANYDGGTVTVVDGATDTVSNVTVGQGPSALDVNPITNKIYVANYGDGTVTVVDGATGITKTIAAGQGPLAVAVNPVTNKIYVANYGSNSVSVIDGASGTVARSVPTGSGPSEVAPNTVTNQIYVTNARSNSVTVIDGNTNGTTTIAVGAAPGPVVVNAVTNRIYVGNQYSFGVTVIDGKSNGTTTVSTGEAYSLALNSVTNRIYVADLGDNKVTVIDGSDNTTTSVAAGVKPFSIAVNPVTNKIYVANSQSGSVTVIDGATNSTTAVTTGSYPSAIAVNQATGKIYVANRDAIHPTVTIISERQVQPIPLSTSIGPLTANQIDQSDATFTFTAASGTVTTPNGVCFQLDTWQTAWNAGTPSTGSYTGAVTNLQPGFHTLYAYAVDGQEATSTQAGSPLTGAIQAYGFAVGSLATSVVSLSPKHEAGATQTFTAIFSDPRGTANIGTLRLLVNNPFNPFNRPKVTNSCYVLYSKSKNLLYLENDSATGLIGGVRPGANQDVSNSQCTLEGNDSSVGTSGLELTLTVSLTASAAFLGLKDVYLLATDENWPEDKSASTGWVWGGTWGQPLQTLAVASFSPHSGSGITQTFTGVYSDPNGIADIATVRLLLNKSVNPAHACYVLYYRYDNTLYLENDGGSGYAGGITPGSAGQVSNGQCTLSGAGSSVSVDGNNLTLNAALTFSGSFTGSKEVYLLATGNRWPDNVSASTGWVVEGSWTP